MKKNESIMLNIEIPKEYYNNIINILNDYTDYISSYQSLTEKYSKEILNIYSKFKEKYNKYKVNLKQVNNYDFSNILHMINSLPKIHFSFAQNLEYSSKELGKFLSELEDNLKEKKIVVSKILLNLSEEKKDLVKYINNNPINSNYNK